MRGSKAKRLRREPGGPVNPGRKSGGIVGPERKSQAWRKREFVKNMNMGITHGRTNGMSDGS